MVGGSLRHKLKKMNAEQENSVLSISVKLADYFIRLGLRSSAEGVLNVARKNGLKFSVNDASVICGRQPMLRTISNLSSGTAQALER